MCYLIAQRLIQAVAANAGEEGKAMGERETDYGSVRLKSRDLYKASEAVAKLEALVGSSVETKKHLIDQVKSDRLAVFARRRWEIRDNVQKNLRKTRPDFGIIERKRVGWKTFRDTPDVLALAENWNWKAGIFYLPRRTKKGNFSRSVVLDGVRFKKSDIDLMVNGLTFALITKGQRGRPTKEAHWDRFTVELVEFAKSPDFDLYLASFDALRAAFDDFYRGRVEESDRLKEPTYKGRLSALYNHAKDA